MERKNRIFKSFSTALIAIMMFTAMMPSWAYGETAGSGAAVQTAEQQAAQSTASALGEIRDEYDQDDEQ